MRNVENRRSWRPSADELKRDASGRWPDLFHLAAGLPIEHLDGGNYPCVFCGGVDRFWAHKDVVLRGSVQCRHCFNSGTDPRPGDGIATLRWLLKCDFPAACQWLSGELGLTGTMAASKPLPQRSSVTLQLTAKRSRDLAPYADQCHRAMKSGWWPRMEALFGVPAEEFVRLRVGWCDYRRVTTWPMVNNAYNVVGIRTRNMKTGKKKSISTGDAGMFVPADWSPSQDRLFLPEGPTDSAALTSIGFDCIGRPSCDGAFQTITAMVSRLQPIEVVIVADRDANGAGKRGAESLAPLLITVCPRVRIIYPPAGINDARDWITGGATAEDVLTVVEAAEVRKLTLSKETKK